jgi:HEAT repeat protein
MSQLRTQLSDIEPDDRTYEGIDASEVDLLRQLLDDEEPWLAARAVYALSRIDAESAHRVLLAASKSPRPEVRVAVAASAGALPPRVSDQVLSRLLDDPELGVRKFAVKSTSERNSEAVKKRLERIATTEANAAVQQIAEEKAKSLLPP